MSALVLSKAHLRRLRHYFGKRHAGTVADNIDLDLVGVGFIHWRRETPEGRGYKAPFVGIPVL